MNFNVTETMVVEAPPDEVFALITDVNRLPEWNREIRTMHECPPALTAGAEWVVEIHAMGTHWRSRSTLLDLDREAGVLAYEARSDDGNPSVATWVWRVTPHARGAEARRSQRHAEDVLATPPVLQDPQPQPPERRPRVARRAARLLLPFFTQSPRKEARMTTTTGFVKSINSPDEVRDMPNARLDLVKVDDLLLGRLVAQPGWRWSESVRPIAQTESCEVPHQLYLLSGALHVKLDDGTELDLVSSDVAVIPAGHDAWVVGDEPCAMLDFGDDDDGYATPPAS